MATPDITFVDAADLIAVLDRTAPDHALAGHLWQFQFDIGGTFLTTDYAVVKATLELHRRYGVAGVRDLLEQVVPALRVEYCTEADLAMGAAALLSAGDDDGDLVDGVDEGVRRRLRVSSRLRIT
jgi:hypothetical protein